MLINNKKEERIKIVISPFWTPSDRIKLVVAILPIMQTDIYAGKYSDIGRPNITSIMGILLEDSEILNEEIKSLPEDWNIDLVFEG